MEALRVELVQVCVSAETDRAAQAEQAADEEANDTRRGVAGDGEKRETGGRRERLVSQVRVCVSVCVYVFVYSVLVLQCTSSVSINILV